MKRIKSFLLPIFERLGKDNVTGLSAMVAYNLAISIVPFAVLSLWIAGRLVGSSDFEAAIDRDLGAIFPGPADTTLHSLLGRIREGSASIGLISLVASIWTGMSFWGAVDTAFGTIYSLPKRSWLGQKRFAFAMLWLVLLFVAATVAVPVIQSAIAAVQSDLPFGLDAVPGGTLITSLAVGVALLFLTLWAIYALGPNERLRWRAVWPGALAATVVIAALDFIYPYYLTHASSVWRFGTTAVFLVIVLLWFYAIALMILLGAELNSALLDRSTRLQATRSAAISRKQET